MPLKSDMTLDAHLFDPKAIPSDVVAFDQKLMELGQKCSPWYEVGAQKYREMRSGGDTPFPKPLHLDEGINELIPSREPGRNIPVRIMRPQGHDKPVKGVLFYIHGGGFVLQSESGQDPLLKDLADGGNVVVFAVGYRLAPEHPYPAGPEDCYDAVDWLMKNCKAKFDSELKFVCGESAGGYLSLKTFLHLLDSYPEFELKGLLLGYGSYDLSLLPAAATSPKPLVLNTPGMQHFAAALLPGKSTDDRKTAELSLTYVDWKQFRGRLPPALFMVGTEDPLVDDSMLMTMKWMMAGGQAVLKIVPGAPHAFVLFDKNTSSVAAVGIGHMLEFLNDRLQ